MDSQPSRAGSSLSITVVAGSTTFNENQVEMLREAQEIQKPAAKEPAPVYEFYSWRSKSPDTRLVYVHDLATAELELSRLSPGPLGFDLEWKPNRWKGANNPVALVQLANHNTILLIQVTAMRMFPEGLKRLLADPSYLKAGVGIQNDCKKLWADYCVSTRNCVDLGLLARTVDNDRWKGKYTQPIGLARLCQVYENLDLSKGKITRSNWELYLDELQQDYAANDCHSGLTLYLRLQGMMSNLQPAPSRGYYSFDFFEGLLYHPSQGAPTTLWHPHNPNYDPGPEPERKEKKEKETETGSKNGVNNATDRSQPAFHGRTRSRFPERHQQPPMPITGSPSNIHPLTSTGPLMAAPPGAAQHNQHLRGQQFRTFGQQPQAGWQPMGTGMPPVYDPPYVVPEYVRPYGRGRERGGSRGNRGGFDSYGGVGGRGRGRGRGRGGRGAAPG